MKCTAKAKSTGKRCTRWAVEGYRVCPVHGAGTKKRVKAGTRRSPKTAALTTGERSTQETIEFKKKLDPAYEHCYNEILSNPQLANLDEMANRIYASLLAMDYQELSQDERAMRLKSLALAISKVEQARTTQSTKFEREQKLFVDAVKKVFYEFVPRERLAEAASRLRTLIGEVGDVGDGGGDEPPGLPGSAPGADVTVS